MWVEDRLTSIVCCMEDQQEILSWKQWITVIVIEMKMSVTSIWWRQPTVARCTVEIKPALEVLELCTLLTVGVIKRAVQDSQDNKIETEERIEKHNMVPRSSACDWPPQLDRGWDPASPWLANTGELCPHSSSTVPPNDFNYSRSTHSVRLRGLPSVIIYLIETTRSFTPTSWEHCRHLYGFSRKDQVEHPVK